MPPMTTFSLNKKLKYGMRFITHVKVKFIIIHYNNNKDSEGEE